MDEGDAVESVGEMEAVSMSPNILALEAAVFVGLCAMVVIGNTLICVVDFYKLAQMRFINILLLLICTIDVFVSLITMPLIIVALIRMRWEFGDSMCKTTGMATLLFIAFALSAVSLAFLYHVVMIFRGCIVSENAPIRREGFLAIGLFMLGISVCLLMYLIDWKVFQQKPTVTMCVLTNSPNYSAYKMFYGFFSLIVPLMVIMFFAKSDKEKLERQYKPSTMEDTHDRETADQLKEVREESIDRQ